MKKIYTAFTVILFIFTATVCIGCRAGVTDTEGYGTETEHGKNEALEPAGTQRPEETAGTQTEAGQREDSPQQEQNGQQGSENIMDSEKTNSNAEKAAQIIGGMTLREKIYQMCIITPEDLGGRWPVTMAHDDILQKLEECHVGGIIFFADHLQNPDQTKRLLGALQERAVSSAGLPLFLCVDEEGGKVSRIAPNKIFGVKDVGPMKEVESVTEALEAGRTLGEYLSRLGFNVDFAPDVDVLTAPGSKIIGDRSFGDDPGKVTEYGAAVSDGLHEYGILSCFKHYPGHGAVEEDTHKGLAYTDKTLEEFMACEMIPFAKAGEKHVDMIMAAHISVPSILGDNTPCSLSRYMLTDVLREKLGYEGLIITDALNMGAITDICASGESAVAAVGAGADIILMPPDLEEAVSAVEEAVQAGGIAEEQIDASVLRIIMKKLEM